MPKGVALSHDGGDSWSAVRFPWRRGSGHSQVLSPVCQASIATIGGEVYYTGPNSSSRRAASTWVRVTRRSALSISPVTSSR